MLDQTKRRQIDRAYFGHALLALAVGWVFGLALMLQLGRIDLTTSQALGMLTGVPAGLIGFAGFTVAIYHSVRLWRILAEEKGLLVLLLVLAFTITMVAMSAEETELPNWKMYSLCSYPVVASFAIVRWFGFAKRQHGEMDA